MRWSRGIYGDYTAPGGWRISAQVSGNGWSGRMIKWVVERNGVVIGMKQRPPGFGCGPLTFKQAKALAEELARIEA